jgi:hypothetical protein
MMPAMESAIEKNACQRAEAHGTLSPARWSARRSASHGLLIRGSAEVSEMRHLI